MMNHVNNMEFNILIYSSGKFKLSRVWDSVYCVSNSGILIQITAEIEMFWLPKYWFIVKEILNAVSSTN